MLLLVKGRFEGVDPSATYSNTKWQLGQLEDLLSKLPALDEPAAPVSDRPPRPKRQRRLSQEQLQQLVAGYQAGATVYELGARFGISRQAAARQLQRCGVTMRRQGLTPAQVHEAIRLYAAGWSLARLGERFQVDASTVFRQLRERGVRMRDTHGRER